MNVQLILVQLPLFRCYRSNTVAAQLKITLDDSLELDVVDVITFKEEGPTAQILAYKGVVDKYLGGAWYN